MIVPHVLIDKLVDFYNDGNAEAFCNIFSPDASVYEHPNRLTQQGRQELFEYYSKVFAAFPQNQTRVLYRVITGNRVIDHEQVQRSPDHKPFEVVSIYELNEDGLIQRLDFIRKEEDVY